MDLQRLLECKRAGFPVLQYLSFVEKEIRRIDLKRMELGWLVYSDGFSFGVLDRCMKRLFDLLVSAIVLLLTAPLVLGGVVAIRLEGPGSVLYRQQRVTRDGRVFWIMKLRTMRMNAEDAGAVWAAEADSRITRAGSFLRRARIDELPQLVNILRGEMSFVGPRPEQPQFVAELAEKIPLYNERHMVKAGLTGWAQINYPYGASIDDARSKLSYDLYYVKNYSILFDFVILLQTLRVVLWPVARGDSCDPGSRALRVAIREAAIRMACDDGRDSRWGITSSRSRSVQPRAGPAGNAAGNPGPVPPRPAEPNRARPGCGNGGIPSGLPS